MRCFLARFLANMARNAGISDFDSISAGSSTRKLIMKII
jgi:hypothetical protein